mgnify:CR=1 FL=1
MAHASLNALINADGNKGINIVAVFDNEEVGSSTKQGADSNMLLNILERICIHNPIFKSISSLIIYHKIYEMFYICYSGHQQIPILL